MGLTFRVEQIVRAPPDRVFRTLTDLGRAAEWMPGLVRIERLDARGRPGLDEADDARLSVGSAWRETRSFLGREATEEFEVTALDPPRRLDLRVDGSKGSSGRGEYLFAYEFAPVEDGTRVRLDGEIRGLRAPGALLARLFVGPYRKACARDLRALARHLDPRRRFS